MLSRRMHVALPVVNYFNYHVARILCFVYATKMKKERKTSENNSDALYKLNSAQNCNAIISHVAWKVLTYMYMLGYQLDIYSC